MTTVATAQSSAQELATQQHAFVNGSDLVGSEGPRDVINPANGQVLRRISVTSVEQCLSAVAAAARVQEQWGARPPRERAEILRAAYEILARDEAQLARLITLENGKASPDAVAEARYAAEFFRWFAEEAVRVPGDLRRSPTGNSWIMVTHEPVGVCLLVTPWNFPAAMATRKIAPALAAGCAVVLKPAMETPLTALFVAHRLTEAGVPPGVVNVVLPGSAGPAINAMLAEAPVRAVSFTGSTEVGRLLLEQSAKRVANASMELGGNAPFIICDDADLGEAVDGLMVAKFRNGGAACTAANRIIVDRSIADRLVAALADRIRALTVGDGRADGTQVGPMVSAAERNRIAGLVDRAVAEGARLVVRHPSTPEHGFFYPPTLLDNVSPDSEIARTEIFGPVAVILRVDGIDEAVRVANDTEAGLVSYVFTQRFDRGLGVSRRLQSGMVGLNRGLVSDPAAPFGGSKQSGLGREGAHEGMLEFMETKYISAPYV